MRIRPRYCRDINQSLVSKRQRLYESNRTIHTVQPGACYTFAVLYNNCSISHRFENYFTGKFTAHRHLVSKEKWSFISTPLTQFSGVTLRHSGTSTVTYKLAFCHRNRMLRNSTTRTLGRTSLKLATKCAVRI